MQVSKKSITMLQKRTENKIAPIAHMFLDLQKDVDHFDVAEKALWKKLTWVRFSTLLVPKTMLYKEKPPSNCC